MVLLGLLTLVSSSLRFVVLLSIVTLSLIDSISMWGVGIILYGTRIVCRGRKCDLVIFVILNCAYATFMIMFLGIGMLYLLWFLKG